MPKQVTITCTPEQAYVISGALEFFARIGMGQLTEIDYLAKTNRLMYSKTAVPNSDGKLSIESTEELREALIAAQKVLGFDGAGHSHGIASDRVHHDMRFCHEMHKVLAKELAMQRDPNPSFRTVDYDGLTLRVTDEEPIKVSIADVF
jgi:hypothetical protein